MKRGIFTRSLAGAAAAALVLAVAACGSDEAAAPGSTTTPSTAAAGTSADASTPAVASSDAGTPESSMGASEPATSAPTGDLIPVKLQLQWVAQGQFAGYYAAAAKGFYAKQGLDVTIVEGGGDIVPQDVLSAGDVDFAISWVPKALQSIENGAKIIDIAQIYQKSATLQISMADKNIKSVADLKGKNVGSWGYGNEFELFAGLTKDGLNPASDITLVQQQFDMVAFLAGDIDAAQAMTYNEYAQVLESINPATGALYTPEELNVINWNDEGTAMLQDAIWANSEKLAADATYKDTATKFVAGSIEGWAYCRDNVDECAQLVVDAGSQLGATHQKWMTNEVNKLIWPSPKGAGYIDEAAWKQTVDIAMTTKNDQGSTVITKDPGTEVYTNEIVEAAWALLGDSVDVKGESYTPATITLTEGGK